ncbi:hypothetical protein GJ496_004243 [Pomphorhynchus laevis]|nr:hypothetical protein GJ496_004243 [Pomphorhynchus laevis]
MKRRIERWNSDNWSERIAEARYLQSTIKSRECMQAQIDWKVAFRRSMQNGDTKAAIKSLEDASGGSYLNPDDFIGSSTVRQLLESKHPEGDRLYVEGVMTCPHPNLLPFHPVMFDKIDAESIITEARRTRGSAGPSGVDASTWKQMLTSFDRDSMALADALAGLTRRLVSGIVPKGSTTALVASRLIAVAKNNGMRPIGVGEV